MAPEPQTPQAGLAQEEGLLPHLWLPKPPVFAGTGVRRKEQRPRGQSTHSLTQPGSAGHGKEVLLAPEKELDI